MMHRLCLALCFVALAVAVPTELHVDEEERYICFGNDKCEMMTLQQALHYRELHGKDCSDFIDFTDHRHMQVAPLTRTLRVFPAGPTHQNEIRPMLNELSKANLQANVEALSKHKNRYYTSASGVESMQWVLKQFQNMPGVEASLFQHAGYKQPSVIARIKGTSNQVVVVGAHGDSISGRGGDNVAPGADDDASGVANLLEAARVIAKHVQEGNFQPTRTIEFMVYAAEEVGLRGSLDIADSYFGKVDVYAVYQIEMSGYNANLRSANSTNEKAPSSVGLITDHVDASLTAFTRTLVKEYLNIPARDIKCGYGCSDHAAWYQSDFAGVCAAEAGPYDVGNLNPYMHTTGDLPTELDFAQCLEFAKLALSFSVELAL